MKDHFKRLFEYDRWANQQVYNTLAANDVIDDRIISLFSHVLWATSIWHLRLTNQPMPLPYMPFAEIPYAEMQTRINNQFDKYIAFIEQVTDFNSTCTYTDLKGNQHTTALHDILTHIANHATYHRGQLASRIKELGLQPPGTDYILFTRL